MKAPNLGAYIFIPAFLLTLALAVGISLQQNPALSEQTEQSPAIDSLYFSPAQNEESDSLILSADSLPPAGSLHGLPEIERLLAWADSVDFMRHAAWTFVLADTAGNSLISRNPDMSLAPASVMKMLTTAAVLDIAGPDRQMQTRLQYSGRLDTVKHVLYGNLYLRGGGDPSLGSEVFGSSAGAVINAFRKAVRRAGIDSVKGAVVADARIFEYQMYPSGWTLGDVQYDYGAGVSGLSFSDNVVFLKLAQSRITAVKPYPVPGLTVDNRLVVNPKAEENQVFWQGDPYENRRTLLGVVRGDTATARLPVPDPAFWLASAFYRALRADSVFVADSVTSLRKAAWPDSLTKPERSDLLVLPSPKIKHLARFTNTVSQNFYAETLLKLAGLYSGRYGGTYAGCAAVREFLAEQKIPLGGYFQTDGSGLSRFNAVTGRFLTDALSAFAKNERIFEPFYESLAVAGRTGTMSKMCIGSPAENNVRAKSGTMQHIKAYAGYVRDRNGRLLVFSAVSNNHNCSAARMSAFFEKLMIAAAEIGEGNREEVSDVDSLQLN